VRQVTLYGSGAAAELSISLKKAGRKAAGTAYMNIGTQTTADRTNIVPKTTTKGFLLEI
jgi:vitamin B12 transporter